MIVPLHRRSGQVGWVLLKRTELEGIHNKTSKLALNIGTLHIALACYS